MEHLPDDVLLEVMQHLGVRHLFALRLVCKRFESLALSPHLWRHLYAPGHDDGDPHGCYGCSSLRLAPCLRHMSLTLPLQRHHKLYATTRCGVSNLAISVHDAPGGTAGAVQADLVIRNQEALGRMKILDLYLPSNINETPLLRTVATISGLESLRISCYSRAFPRSLTGLRMPRSSLKHFSCTHRPRSEAFCNLMLTTHAATLEHVDLLDEYTPSSATAPLLAAIPNLRQLECCTLPGLGAVGAACESLASLELNITRGEPGERFESRMREAAELLRHAKQLRRLELKYNSSDVSMPAAADMDLILALVPAGRRSRLEWLRICNLDDDWDGYSYQLQTLWDLLPSLPCLRHLDVGPVPFEFLLRVTPETTPALRTLMVFTESGDAVCAHDFLHTEVVQTVLSVNPSLRLYVYLPKYCGQSDPCEACALGCHQELRDDKMDYYTLQHLLMMKACDHVLIPR
ncbi:uncharacterized protein LOC113207323 [Frankliniella occidentalis]|uniref:Uncharacterized protein LOC113207323 n=1 Tax=Frankliniella occidentalis TaxID=133901 RepID=A0A9C6X029_FRAOC|nr:uncharacterized protein LOC113207323 [Frankliniella occidentalis]